MAGERIIDDGRVFDAPSNNWVYRVLPRAAWPFAQLARWDRPIGWWLLLWPCWWSLLLVLGSGHDLAGTVGSADLRFFPIDLALLAAALFMIGAVAMRGAGCTYNDIVDVDFDARVARTASRPIPSGRVTKLAALVFLALQLLVGFCCLLALSLLGGFDPFVFLLGIASMVVVVAYPFAKRFVDFPQLVLGLAFSWGGFMGWAVVSGEVSVASVLLYAAAVCWTIGYDTIYAHQDIEDDILIGVRSTAIMFGDRSRSIILVLYAATCGLLLAAFVQAGASWPAYAGLGAGAIQMIWQITRLNITDPQACLALFRSNTMFGWLVGAGLLAALFA